MLVSEQSLCGILYRATMLEKMFSVGLSGWVVVQAAEPIIDFAQRTQRPFAMVPCCVYPAEFPHRRLPDGTLVRKYEQLLEYMQSRSSCIKVVTLPFEGRNQVVYCTNWS